MSEFIINPESEKFIRLQRTSLGHHIEKEYFNSAYADFNSIREHLPRHTGRVLDIGCGIAAIDFFIGNTFPEAKIFLMDKSEIEDEIYYGYQKKGCFYNSLELAEDFLRKNGIENKIEKIDVSKEFNLEKDIDLIISLISWGFHYPISTYIKEVSIALSEKGVIICDIRNTAYEAAVKEFSEVGLQISQLLLETKSYSRFLVKR